jgi:hypothetical protein
VVGLDLGAPVDLELGIVVRAGRENGGEEQTARKQDNPQRKFTGRSEFF